MRGEASYFFLCASFEQNNEFLFKEIRAQKKNEFKKTYIYNLNQSNYCVREIIIKTQ